MSREILGEYVRAGLLLVPIPSGLKSPVMKGWQQKARCISDPEVAEFIDGNIGLAHAYSGTVCLDIDDYDKAVEYFAARGVDLSAWLDAPDAVQITSGRQGRAKLIYKGPVLPTFSLKPMGFELRCGNNAGTTMQDVLPPSIHPDTGKPYEWAGAGSWRNIPDMPLELLALWQGMIKPDTKLPREERETRMELQPLREMVANHDPDGDYDSWVRVGMAIHHETDGSDDGLAIWDQWSSLGEKYKGTSDLESHWRSFRLDGNNPVTVASLRVDTAADISEFAIVTQEQVDKATKYMPIVPGTKGISAEAAAKLERDKAGNAYATLPNVLAMLEDPNTAGSAICFDDFKSELMLTPVEEPNGWRPIRDTDYTAVRLWLENNARFYPVSKDLVRDTVHYIGESHKMDSAQEWLLSLKWDRVQRIKDFMPRYMGTLDAEYERSVGVYLWTALAGRVMEPGCQADMCPILVGKQGIGKSRGIQAMVPDPSFYVEIRLDEDDDDIARKMRGVLIGEIAELRGLRTSDADRIKAFVTRTHEKWTPKYMEHSTSFARRLVMIGTTNEDEFLSDTENRRWLPVRTTGVNTAAIKRDMEQLWAEAYELWLAGGIVWKGAEELAKDARSDFETEDNWIHLVRRWVDETRAEHYTTSDVLTLAIGLDSRNISKAHEMRLAKIMRTMGFERTQKRVNGRPTKLWVDKGLVDLLA
jgi:predicted P-loop ATPase